MTDAECLAWLVANKCEFNYSPGWPPCCWSAFNEWTTDSVEAATIQDLVELMKKAMEPKK